jgi:hypothetical protein
MVQENARKSERENAHRARFRLLSDATDATAATQVRRDGSHRPSFFELPVSTQLLHGTLIFHASLDECVFLTAV